MMRRLIIPGVFAAALGAPQLGEAQSVQSPEMVTDRPDFTESSEVIRRGRYQFESGLTIETDGAGASRSHGFTAPYALMRIGLGRRTELRLGAEGFVWDEVGDASTAGVSDFGLAAKIRLFDQDQIGVDLAVIPILSLPTGSDDVSSGTYDPAVKITWARGMAAGFDLTGNVNVSALSDAAGRYDQEAISVSVGHDLFAGWGMYAEVFGFSRLDRDGGAAFIVNGGVTRAVGDRMQFDIEAGHGITSAAPDWFVGVGFAIRGSLRH